MLEGGYWTVARWRTTPIRLHWTTPLGMLVLGRLRFVPGFWLGFVAVLLVHEVGHAYLVRRMGLRVLSIDVHGLGGACRYAGHRITQWQRTVIAWGGVLGQVLLVALALPVVVFGGAVTREPLVAELVSALVEWNLILVGLNLLPIRPLDGAQAWKIVGLTRRRRQQRIARQARRRRDANGRDALAREDVDPLEVREAVRRALADAARESQRGRTKRQDPS